MENIVYVLKKCYKICKWTEVWAHHDGKFERFVCLYVWLKEKNYTKIIFLVMINIKINQYNQMGFDKFIKKFPWRK